MFKVIKFLFITVIVAITSFTVGRYIFPFLIELSNLISAITFQNIVDLCTAVGSLATFFTFIYLILQNKEQKAHEEQQIKMWNEQNEMLCFQKYQTHRTEFFNLITSIEERYEGIFVVKHKNRLYRRIFPRNSFVSIQYNYESEALCADNPLLAFERLVDRYKQETAILKLKKEELQTSKITDENIRRAVYELDLCTCNLLSLFELECVLSPKLGFIHDGDFVVMDGLSPFSQIGKLIDIANEFRQFTNMSHYYGTGGGLHQPLVVAKNVIPYYLNKDDYTSRTIFGDNLIVLLLELHEIIESLDDELAHIIISHIKPLDFFGYNSLLNNFDYSIEMTANELHSRVTKLLTYSKSEIENDPQNHKKLIKLSSKLEKVISKS
ncbi:hypothetical protein [Photobacterium leiognathi]|uniref:hypothetical protein n=1 Tax=Photobacterium leiognathi TaxID=553611 RepID=UPI00273852AC|nr:hypothetical protein [Photobacterium leiognathi]